MLYVSTRNTKIKKSPSEAILSGLAEDGGLYVPENFDALAFPMERLLKMTNTEVSTEIFRLLFSGDGLLGEDGENREELYQEVLRAYDGKFEGGNFAPLAKVSDTFVLELYHGPTCAFKDVALQILPRLLVGAKKALGVEEDLVILTATSGDTGSAALAGFSGVAGVNVIVFYPEKGISAVQKQQMVTCTGRNADVCAVCGNFDDAQSGVKNIFARAKGWDGVRLSSANSMNIGRLAPQIAYYFTSYRDLTSRGEISFGEEVNYVVPTGNFGDILAGYFAKKMGLPIGKLVCASNENNVLTEFFQSGTYCIHRKFHVTQSPSMDILVSSNLERLLFLVGGEELCASAMARLAARGRYEITAEELRKLQESFVAGFATDEETSETIRRVYDSHGYLMDPHTAVAWSVYEKVKNTEGVRQRKTVVLSTASPYKFASCVLEALGQCAANDFDAVEKLHNVCGIPVPQALEEACRKKVIHTDRVKKDEMPAFVQRVILRKKEEKRSKNGEN